MGYVATKQDSMKTTLMIICPDIVITAMGCGIDFIAGGSLKISEAQRLPHMRSTKVIECKRGCRIMSRIMRRLINRKTSRLGAIELLTQLYGDS